MDPPPDSSTSSPRATSDASLDDHAPSYHQQPPQKLRLMCSYGGHIVPRPHDKSLCYVGGDTRIVVVDCQTATLSSLTSRLSSNLLNGRPFTLKYQLPNEDLDSLISVTTDEDLENMLEEYDRTTANSSSTITAKHASRLRLFLFPLMPESTQSLLDNGVVKNEDWFLNALNGTHLNRGFSDSAASSVNCLLGLDDPLAGGGGGSDGNNREIEGLSGNSSGNKSGSGVKQDVHSVPDSPMMETTSSFGSTSSSPTLVNLPPIKVHVEDHQKAVVGGIEEQFAQINVGGGDGGGGGGLKQDEGFLMLSLPPPMPVSILPTGVVGGGVGEYRDRVYSDDERSDHGGGVSVLGGGYRKQQQQVPPPQRLPSSQELGQLKSSGGGVIDVPSPDSVSSDSSFSNAMNRPKPFVSQEFAVQIPLANGVPRNPVDQNTNLSDLSMRVPVQQVQDSGYVLQPQFDQQLPQQQPQQTQQFIPSGAHYIHHHPGGPVPISAYYPVGVYPPQQQQQHQQYSVYYVPARQPQAYNLNLQQSGNSEAGTAIPSSFPQMPPNATMVQPTSAYYPVRNAPVSKPEMATAGMYRTANTGTPQLVQVPSSQHQQQYVTYSQVHHPSQSVVPSSAGTGNYAYEFVDPAHAQMYYTQPLATTIPAQYQTMTGAAAVVLPEVSAQLSSENIKQQIRTSQPI